MMWWIVTSSVIHTWHIRPVLWWHLILRRRLSLIPLVFLNELGPYLLTSSGSSCPRWGKSLAACSGDTACLSSPRGLAWNTDMISQRGRSVQIKRNRAKWSELLGICALRDRVVCTVGLWSEREWDQHIDTKCPSEVPGASNCECLVGRYS